MSICETQICENNTCQNFNIIAKNYDSFHSVGITKQLNHIIKKNYNSISKYLSDSQRCSYDIIYGSQYQTQTGTLNLLTYTDGIQIYKSTAKRSVWPALCNIIELPQVIRESVCNKIISGIWAGKNKPKSDTLFSNLIQEIIKIKQNGLIFKLKTNPEKYLLICMVLKAMYLLKLWL